MKKNEKVIDGNSNKTIEAGNTFRLRGMSAIVVWLGAGFFFVVTALISVIQVGWKVTGKPLQPKFDKFKDRKSVV